MCKKTSGCFSLWAFFRSKILDLWLALEVGLILVSSRSKMNVFFNMSWLMTNTIMIQWLSMTLGGAVIGGKLSGLWVSYLLPTCGMLYLHMLWVNSGYSSSLPHEILEEGDGDPKNNHLKYVFPNIVKLCSLYFCSTLNMQSPGIQNKQSKSKILNILEIVKISAWSFSMTASISWFIKVEYKYALMIFVTSMLRSPRFFQNLASFCKVLESLQEWTRLDLARISLVISNGNWNMFKFIFHIVILFPWESLKRIRTGRKVRKLLNSPRNTAYVIFMFWKPELFFKTEKV